jgi:hypothetical protein
VAIKKNKYKKSKHEKWSGERKEKKKETNKQTNLWRWVGKTSLF